jgi:signal transduction histidine kinase
VRLEVQPDSGLGLETLHIENALIGPDGAFWISNAQGVLRWNGERFERQVGDEGGPVQGLAFEDAETFWTYRTGLLQQWRKREGVWREASRADAANEGIPSADAGGLVRDAHGRLWIFGVRGLVRFDPGTRSLRLFGPGDGLREREFGLRPPRVLPDGSVVAGTVGGAVLFHPLQVAADNRVPPMVLDALTVRRAEDLVHLDPAGEILLQPNDRDLRVVARLMSFADPAAHRFRYRLHGYDPDWVDVGPSGERQLPRQLPGRYRLDIVAAGADGRWGEPLRLDYRVLPPWWLSVWALLAYAVLALGAMAGVVLFLRHRVQVRAEERREREARRLAQEASEAKSQFLADLGHELRTPLTGVLGMTELMLKEPLPEAQRQRAETVLRAGQHLLRLVNDTLDLARIEAGRLLLQEDPFDLAALLADVAQWLRPAAEAKGLHFSARLAPGVPPWLRGDAARVRQILLNLGGNAIKFTEQGTVAIRIAPMAGGGIELEVEDSGIGLDAQEQQRLFQRFAQADGEATQRRYGGTGLGLAISRQLARAMGGDLHLYSRKGEGSRFTVRLPLAEASPGSASGSAEAPQGVSGSTSAPPSPAAAGAAEACLDILLVEDDPVVAEVMTGLLQAMGHRVHHAPQALSAMTLLKTRRLDLGLLDLDLPAVDGFELARLIRQSGWSLPLVAVTARADVISERRARAAGMDGYLRKPVTGAMLAEALAGIHPSGG